MPCAFGVLTVDTMEQALARAGGGKRHQGEDAARAVLRMAELRRELTGSLPRRVINLYSDTQTRPTRGHAAGDRDAPRWATSSAGQDPTTLRLQERVAELLGHEAGLFLPSGTMCNQISFRLHARPGGDELILDRTAHPIIAEAGGPAQQAGLMINALDGDGGIFTREQLVAASETARGPLHAALAARLGRADHEHGRRPRVAARGSPREVLEVAREHGLRAHLDGARLMNAVVASGVPAARVRRRLRHGLARLHQGPRRAGGRGAVRLARADRRGVALEAEMGGAFRQSGIVAAGCLYALDHHVERLAEDHENARVLADGLAELGLRGRPAGDQHRHLRRARRRSSSGWAAAASS